jgi:hypothetical protein
LSLVNASENDRLNDKFENFLQQQRFRAKELEANSDVVRPKNGKKYYETMYKFINQLIYYEEPTESYKLLVK